MYVIRYYKDDDGHSEVKELIDTLGDNKSKDARIQLAKIKSYLELLEEYGKSLGEPFIKPIKGSKELWELRPLRHRIFFVAWYDNQFVLLSHYIKKTEKTPRREIEKAERFLKKLKESEQHE